MGACIEKCVCGSCLSPDGLMNMFGCGKECCQCCYCCLDEPARVGRVLDNFQPLTLRSAPQHANEFQMYVGRVTLPPLGPRLQAQCMYSPGSMRPCVYWRVNVQEEWIEWEEVDDYEERGQGDNKRSVKVGSHWEKSHRWDKIVDKENFVDFYLQDGAIKMFVEGSKRGQCKIQSEWDAGGGNSWNIFSHNSLPQGIKWMVNKYATGFGGWGRSWYSSGYVTMPTGRFQWSECVFEVNEKIACLGITSPTFPDPYTQTGNTALIPFNKNMMNRDDMSGDGWSYWDKFAWEDLLDGMDAVMLSDKTKYTDAEKIGFDVLPHSDLPKWMTVYTPQYAPWASGGVQMVQQTVAVAPGTSNVPMYQQPQVQIQMQPQAVAMAQTVPMGGGGGGMGGGMNNPAAGGSGGGPREVDFKLKPGQKAMALKTMMELKGSTVYIINLATQSPVKMRNNFSIFGNGGLGDAATWTVQGMGPSSILPEGDMVYKFMNAKQGKFLAIRDGMLTFGEGGEHCEFVVRPIDAAVLLVKHRNVGARMGFRANGEPEVPQQLRDGAKARFFLFDVDDVQDKFLA